MRVKLLDARFLMDRIWYYEKIILHFHIHWIVNSLNTLKKPTANLEASIVATWSHHWIDTEVSIVALKAGNSNRSKSATNLTFVSGANFPPFRFTATEAARDIWWFFFVHQKPAELAACFALCDVSRVFHISPFKGWMEHRTYAGCW